MEKKGEVEMEVVVLGNRVAMKMHAQKCGWVGDSREDWFPSNKVWGNVLYYKRKIRCCYVL
jgi:hypothetical protein